MREVCQECRKWRLFPRWRFALRNLSSFTTAGGSNDDSDYRRLRHDFRYDKTLTFKEQRRILEADGGSIGPYKTGKMGDASVTASSWRLVERGRVVLFKKGQYAGKLAAIAQIIDHRRVRSNETATGPSGKPALVY